MAKVVGPLHGKKSFLLQDVIVSEKETKLAGAGVIKGEIGTNNLISYEIKSMKSKIKDNVKDEEILQKHVIDMLQTTVKKMQEELHVEVGGFGNTLHIQDPKVWKKVKKDWEENFSQIPVTFEVKLKIEGLGASDTTTE